MPFTFAMYPVARLVCVTLDPPWPSPDEFAALLQAVATHPDYRPGFDILYDRRAVRGVPPDRYHEHKAVVIRALARALGRPRVAVLVGDPEGFELEWKVGAQVCGWAVLRPFRREAEARAWLTPG